MNFEIKFTPEAEETYNSVIEQLRQRWGDSFVSKFETKVLKSIDMISDTPFIYAVADKNTDIRKCVLHKKCSMFYKVYENNILIAYFWDNRQEPL